MLTSLLLISYWFSVTHIFFTYIYFTCIYIYFCMLHKCSIQYRKNQFKCPVPWTHEELILRCCKNHNEKLNYTNDESLSIWNEQLKIRTMLGALMLCFESQANFRSLEQIEDTAYADMDFKRGTHVHSNYATTTNTTTTANTTTTIKFSERWWYISTTTPTLNLWWRLWSRSCCRPQRAPSLTLMKMSQFSSLRRYNVLHFLYLNTI